MTVIYFVRHAEPDLSVHEDAIRGLSEKGMKDRELVTDFMMIKRFQAHKEYHAPGGRDWISCGRQLYLCP